MLSMPATKTYLLKEQLGKGTQEGIPKTMRRKCHQWTSKEQCSRGASCSFEHDVNKQGTWKRRLFLSPKREDIQKEPEKETSKGEDLLVQVREEKSNKPVCNHFQMEDMPERRNPHAIVGPTHVKSKSGCTWEGHVCIQAHRRSW